MPLQVVDRRFKLGARSLRVLCGKQLERTRDAQRMVHEFRNSCGILGGRTGQPRDGRVSPRQELARDVAGLDC